MAVPECMSRSQARILNPKQLTLTRDAFGLLELRIGIEERYRPVKVGRCLPLTDPDRYISFQQEEGDEIGLLEEVASLERESRRVLEEELDLCYLKAEVKGIRRVNPRQGFVSWEVDTNLGPRTIYIRERSDIRPLPDGRIVLTDIHGAKYEIPAMEQLDERSRAWLEIEM